jgi:hypothetical protein
MNLRAAKLAQVDIQSVAATGFCRQTLLGPLRALKAALKAFW